MAAISWVLNGIGVLIGTTSRLMKPCLTLLHVVALFTNLTGDVTVTSPSKDPVDVMKAVVEVVDLWEHIQHEEILTIAQVKALVGPLRRYIAEESCVIKV